MDRDIEKKSADLLVDLLNAQTDIAGDSNVIAKRTDDYSTLDPGTTIEVEIMSDPVTGHPDYELLWLTALIMINSPVAGDPDGSRVNDVQGWVRQAIYEAADLRASLSDGTVYCYSKSIRVESTQSFDDNTNYNRLLVLRWAADQQEGR